MPQIQPQLRSLLSSPRTAKILSRIAQEHNFSDQQKILQAKITGLLILGKIQVNELVQRLSTHLSLDKETSQKIAQEIKDKIFNLIQDHPSSAPLHQTKQKEEKTEDGSLVIKNIKKRNLPKSIQDDFKIESFIKSLGINFSSLQARRLYNVILIYLKDIRDSRQTYSAFTRGIEEGGIGLNKEQADLILKQLKEIKSEGNYFQRKQQRDLPSKGGSVFNEARILDQPEKSRKKPFQAKQKMDFSAQVLKKQNPQASFSLPIKSQSKTKAMADVKAPPGYQAKTDLACLGDLAKLNILSFREKKREFQKKMVKFFQAEPFLAKESFQQSALYGLYQTMIKEALRRGLPIEEIAEQYQKQGKEYLSAEEIEEIAQMLSYSIL